MYISSYIISDVLSHVITLKYIFRSSAIKANRAYALSMDGRILFIMFILDILGTTLNVTLEILIFYNHHTK